MNGLRIYLVVVGLFIMLIIVIVIQLLHRRRMKNENSRGIFHLVNEQTRLAQELERIQIENRTLEKIIQSMITECHCGLDSDKSELSPQFPVNASEASQNKEINCFGLTPSQ